MNELVQEIVVRGICPFLTIEDASNLQSTCSHLRGVISIGLLEKACLDLEDFRTVSLHEDHGACKLRFHKEFGPLLLQADTHTALLRFGFKDQGWGNQKGSIVILERRLSDDVDVDFRRLLGHSVISTGVGGVDTIGYRCQFGYTVIQASRLAGHSWSRSSIRFKPREGYAYAMGYNVGGGGGHALFIRDIKLQSAVHSATLPLANRLVTALSDTFFLDFVEAVIDSNVVGEPVVSLFKSIGLDLEDEAGAQQTKDQIRAMVAQLRSVQEHYVHRAHLNGNDISNSDDSDMPRPRALPFYQNDSDSDSDSDVSWIEYGESLVN